MRKKTAIIFIFMFIGMLFIFPNGTNDNLVNAITEQFDIKDTFETEINNRIYTEFDNYTVGEYFRDVKENPLDFSTSEGFTFEYGSYSIGSHSFVNGKLIIEFKKNTGTTNGYYTVTTPVNIDLLHYSIFEINAKVNITTNIPSIYYKDENRINLVDTVVNKVFLDGTTYKTYTNKLDYKTIDEEEQITELMIICYISGDTADTTAIKYEIDFLNLFRNNRTDYATVELSDSYDFTEDIDGHDFAYATEATSSRKLRISPDGAHNSFYYYNTDDISNYPIFEIGFYSDYNVHSGNHYVFLRLFDTDGDYLQTILNDFTDGKRYLLMVSSNNYTSESGTFELSKYDKSQIYFRSTSGNFASSDYIYLDYVSYYNEDIKSVGTFRKQETSFYRAYRGMKSYVSNVTDRQTFYEGYSVDINSSIKINIPSLEFFPEKIQFYIYATKYYNLSIHIGDFNEILYENTLYLDEWMFVSKRINRYNYLLNDTTDEIYFKISYNCSGQSNLFYIDELSISYTEPPQSFSHDFDTRTGNYLDGYEYNTTNNYFHIEPSGQYLYSMNEDSDGIIYNSYSSNIFSRRMFIDYTLDCDEANVDIKINQTIQLSLDKEYRLVSTYGSKAFSHTDYYNRQIGLKHYLYVDGIIKHVYSSGILYDYIFDGFNNVEFYVRFQQEDYNTVSITSIYNNKMTGNTSSTTPFAFNINEGDIKNIVNKMNVTSSVTIRPIMVTPIPYNTLNSNPTATLKISREIKHSEPVSSNPDVNIPVAPVWRGGLYALADIWNYCVYYTQLFIYYILNFIRQSMFIQDIFRGIGEFFTTFKTYWTSLIGYLSDFLSALGEIESIGDFISLVISTVATHLENVFNTLVGLVASFIGVLGDIIDGELLGFPILDDVLDAWEAFVLRDWVGFNIAWDNIIPEITEDTIGFLLFIPDWFLSLWLDDTHFLSTIIINGIAIFQQIYFWITILMIVYMVYFSQLIMRRDFDRMRIEITTWVNVVNWIIDGIVFIFHWIFEFLHAVLDVTIPFT